MIIIAAGSAKKAWLAVSGFSSVSAVERETGYY
jgi:hypothetical protein